jgi:hypothetical protein
MDNFQLAEQVDVVNPELTPYPFLSADKVEGRKVVVFGCAAPIAIYDAVESVFAGKYKGVLDVHGFVTPEKNSR